MSDWTKSKPTKPGVFGVRGFNLYAPKTKQVEAIVQVCMYRGKLASNLHECNSDKPSDGWSLVEDHSDNFEWREYVPKATGEQG